MPSGKGVLFLAVNAEIRKKIQKQAGDYVHIVLYPDNEPIEIPKEFLLCLQDDIVALQFFNSLIESEQYKYIRWIYSAKGEQTRVDRIAKTVTNLQTARNLQTKNNDITINPNAQASILIDEPTISAGEKNTIFLFSRQHLFLYFCSEQKIGKYMVNSLFSFTLLFLLNT